MFECKSDFCLGNDTCKESNYLIFFNYYDKKNTNKKKIIKDLCVKGVHLKKKL